MQSCALWSATATPLFKGIDFFTGSEGSLSTENPQNAKGAWNTGIKLSLKPLTVIASGHIKQTPFADFCTADAFFDTVKQNGSLTYGFSYSSTLFSSPLRIQLLGGTLGFSRSISRLKTPQLSSANAIRSEPALLPGIAPTLPSFTASPTPLAGALTIQSAQPHCFFPTLQAAYTETGELYASVYKTFAPPLFTDVTLSFTAGLFKYGRPLPETGWFQKERPFLEKQFLALETECSFSLGPVKSSTAAALVESPFGGAYLWVRTSNSVAFSHFSVLTDIFACDRPLITAKGSEPHTYFQCRVNPQGTLNILLAGTPVRIQLGLLGQIDLRETKAVCPVEYADYSAKAQSTITFKRTRLTLYTGGSYCTNDKDITFSAKGALSHNTPAFLTSASVGAQCEGKKTTVSVKGALYPKQGILYQTSAGGSLILKENALTSTEVNAGITFKKRVKKVSCTAKITFSVTF